MYQDIMKNIHSLSELPFESASIQIQERIDHLERKEFLDILREIGTIPESIAHDSTEEKLYSKMSDAVLSRAFREIGLKSTVLRERGDSADVLVESPVYGYTLVADAKVFRMSRTAKNQKDFKVAALSGWRNDADYAVLCAPYFQYPLKSSQIYAQALDYQVAFISWEHLIFLTEWHAKETEKQGFSGLWNFCETYSHQILHSDRKQNFMRAFDKTVTKLAGLEHAAFTTLLDRRIQEITRRGKQEINFWEEEIRRIEGYSREEAIQELIESKKIHQKIRQIHDWMRRLQSE